MKNQTKNILAIIIILLIIVVVVWASKSRKAIAPVEETPLDTVASINQDLGQINIENAEVDNNLNSLDTDLNTL